MNVLVTGGAGYIGSVLCGQLLRNRHHVKVVDMFRHGVPSLIRYCSNPDFSIIRGDCRQRRVMEPLIDWADVIIPLAALVGVTECDRDYTAAVTTNLDAIEMLNGLRGNRRVIFPNTNSGYGTSGENICTEESPLKPLSTYGTTKVQAERVLLDKGNVVVFRLATVFGLSYRMRWDLMVNNFVWRAVKDGSIVLFQPEFRRNFVHVGDVVDAFCWALCHPEIEGVYNLGNDLCNTTKLGLAEKVQEATGCQIFVSERGQDPDKRDYNVSSDKLRRAGFTATIGLDDGIKSLVEGVKNF